MTTETQHTPVSAGIKQLVETLRQEGVEAGQLAADNILADARKESAAIVREAEEKAELILAGAKREADFVTSAGKQAFEMANRNAILELKSFLQDEFAQQIQATVGTQLTDQALLKQMILEIAGRNDISRDEALDIILPTKVVGLSDLQNNPEELKEGTLMHFAVAQAAEMLRDGVTFNVNDDNDSAIVFRLKDKDIEVALSDETVTKMMLNHLQPRFRALLEGIVK
ncbi:hypothetical protein [Vibrio sp. WXL210]|uniref:hypothetical protein n=1 Tax=Vibrio sp. WXL210 TaxID=3450709 RepID=UPI003EC67953